MSTTNFHHKGWYITIAPEQRGETWHWTYQIEAGPIREAYDDDIPTEQAARRAAAREAIREVDRVA